LFYINPSRRGPVPVPGPRGRGGSLSRDLASSGARPRPVQGPIPDGVSGAVSAAGCLVMEDADA